MVGVVDADEPSFGEDRVVMFTALGPGGGPGTDPHSYIIELPAVPTTVRSIVLAAISPLENRFEDVMATYCRLINGSSSPKREIAMFDLGAPFFFFFFFFFCFFFFFWVSFPRR